jgi:gliding motility-associated-like protein
MAPEATDNCTGNALEWDYTRSFPITSQVPGDTEIPVDTLTVSLGPLNLDVLTLDEILSVRLSFFNLDADDNNEYFVIRGEDGSILGTTPEIDEECGDFDMELKELITPELLLEWMQDNYLELILEPKIVPEGGIFSINDICQNSFVQFSLLYSTQPVSNLNYAYRLNGGPYIDLVSDEIIDTLLEAGQHELTFRISDCAGNSSECTQMITIVDEQPPVIQCPAGPLQLVLPPDSCTLPVSLPMDLVFQDNCLGQWENSLLEPADPQEQYIQFRYDEELDQYIADNRTIVFNVPAGPFSSNPELTVYIQGDTDEDGEFFEILDENGQVLGQTPTGSCDSLTRVRIPLDNLAFNQWSNDGLIQFVARSTVGQGNINPCEPDAVPGQGGNDGISRLFMALRYETVDLFYEITGATSVGLTPFHAGSGPPVPVLNGGISRVHYILTDQSGNADTCALEIQLIDEQAPQAVCKEALAIFINPSGVEDYILLPEEVDDGSIDNCRIDSMAVVPSVFDCSQAGTTVEVMFYVWDAQGNIDSCQTGVKVETMVLEPSYQSGVCAFDTLKLFANLPDAPPGIYSILWTKENNGFSSNEENPVRPNADSSYSGTYTLEVTGLDGCFSSGFVEVFIEDLSTPVVTSTRDTVCNDDSFTLQTNSYSGNVSYDWYKGLAPNGILIGTTQVPAIPLTANPGQHDYYVIVKSNNCISLPSQKRTIVVLETPVASVQQPFISVCEGDDIVLGTNVAGPSYSYLWWGPDSYNSTDQNPQIIENARIKNQGTYRLAVFNGVCSDTALVQVLVNERPVTPVITSDDIYCEGEPMVLTIGNVTNGDTYSWYLDGDLFTVENTNTLVIPEAQPIYTGNWQAVVKEASCYSDTSVTRTILVEEKLQISASNTGPVCEGDSIDLIAPEIPGAQYTWIGPDNDTLRIPRPVIPAKPGIYQLEVVTEAGCLLNASTEVEVVLVPEITALSNSAPDCIDGTECIEFKPSVYPNLSGYSYSWSGPNGFTSADSIAMLCQPDTSYNGLYSLVVSNGLCQSETVRTEVLMHVFPETPMLSGTDRICETDTLFLQVDNHNGDGMVYFWSTPTGNVFQTTSPSLVLPQVNLASSGNYAIQSFNGFCYSEVSDSLSVEVLKKPNQPVIWTEGSFCEGDPVTLHTHYVNQAAWFWEGPNGFTANVQNPVISPSDTLNEGVYRLQISVNGCFSDPSEGAVVTIRRKPDVPVLQGGLDPLCIVDSTTSFELCLVNPGAAVEYTWYHNDSGTELQQGSSACITVNDLDGVVDGLNGFYALAELDGCTSDPSALLQVELNLVPDRQADAGPDREVCDDTGLFLDARPDPDGYWQSLSEAVVVDLPEDPETGVWNLSEGLNGFIWSLSNGVCYDYDRDTVYVFITRTPEAVDDSYQIAYDQTFELEPVLNDLFAGEAEIIIDPADVERATIEDLGSNIFSFDPSPGFVGEIFFPYLLVHEVCRDKFSEGLIRIRISDADDCFGVNVITPNGDGINDLLFFPCLENPLFPRNKLTVFNQWGDEVYSASPYRNDWQGTYRGRDLPVGTYYYILDLRNGSTPLRDFFVIER